MMGHFMGRETKLPGLLERGEETVLEFKRTAHFRIKWGNLERACKRSFKGKLQVRLINLIYN